jgi:hypothetical protein
MKCLREVCILKVNEERSWIRSWIRIHYLDVRVRGSGAGSAPFVTDLQHCNSYENGLLTSINAGVASDKNYQW